jgi:ribonuclease HI
LWQGLISLSERHARIEWQCVKAHSGILLSECADVLARRGVDKDGLPDNTPQFMVPMREDTDSEEYVLQMVRIRWKMIGEWNKWNELAQMRHNHFETQNTEWWES